MKTRDAARSALAMTAAFLAMPAPAADDPAQRKDLAAVIALNGQACDEVLSYEEQGKNDFVATCKDGNRYRVFVSDAGRVVVKKLGT
jgi:hypothetical protein